MRPRSWFVLFAVVLLFQAAGQSARAQQAVTPDEDPLALWRIKPPEPGQAGDTGWQPQAVPVPKPAPAPAMRKEIPRNEKPMHGDTSLYERKEFDIPAEGSEKMGHTLTYYWKAPKDAKGGPYPLVLVLHNNEGFAHAGEYLVKRDVMHDFPAFVVVPVLPVGKLWAFPEEFPDDPALGYMASEKQALPDVMALIGQLEEDNPIDRHRIYVIGCAEGGFGAYGAAMRHPEVFAAAVPINGGWAIKDSNQLTRTPLLVLHGEKDAIFAPRLSRDVAYYVQMYGGDIAYVQVPGLGHECDDQRLYSKVLWRWLFSQRLRKHSPKEEKVKTMDGNP